MKNQLFFYTEVNGRRITVAGVFSDDHIIVAKAACSNKDKFDKYKGRAIALGRATCLRPAKLKQYMQKGKVVGTNEALLPKTFTLDKSRSVTEQFVEIAKSL